MSGNTVDQSATTKPVCLIVLGMAGSGKTTFVNALLSHLASKNSPTYAINLDPAVYTVPYEPNIGIINRFSKASSFPTVVIYVVDTPRSHNPVTFMSNMLYACSVLYRMRLPFLVVFNKTDIISCDFAIEWVRDFEAFQEALSGARSTDMPPEMEGHHHSGTTSYMTGLVSSMSLVLDEFYNELDCCGVSSVTGEGVDSFLGRISDAVKEYHESYVPWMLKRQEKFKLENGHDADTEKTVRCGAVDNNPAKSTKSSQQRVGCSTMLVDLIGDDDGADLDPMTDLDGIEERGSDVEDEDVTTGTLDDQFRRRCAVRASTSNEANQ